MTKQTSRSFSRRDFLAGGVMAAAGAAAATVLGADVACAAEVNGPSSERIGGWSKDGKDFDLAASNESNASAPDGTYREHNAETFPANDATPIAPRPVPDVWDYECDICVVGAGGGGLNAAARAAQLGAQTICVEALGLPGGNAQEAGMCGILGGYSGQEEKQFAFPSYPFDAKALTDWAMDEYHYAADPNLIYKIASEGGRSLDWMAEKLNT